jgi:myo-inositol 2-dehydrogenase/D-chiro-inositol 1-dehydrogenase
MSDHISASSLSTSRRQFLRSSTAAAALVSTVGLPAFTTGAPNSDKLKIGLIGCGGRGTGAASQAMNADSNVEFWALADVFPEQIEKSLESLKKTNPDKMNVPKSRQFTGLDAYQKLLDSGVDVVLLGTPPGFRPLHLKACIDAGKHVFAEKPVAVDAPGVRSVLATAELAKKKNLSIVSGLCWRYEPGMQETIKRLQNGAIGTLQTMESTRFLKGVAKLVKRTPEMTDVEHQIRNWYYYTWLSGDFYVEQFVHELDKLSWLIGQYPTGCTCSGGRATRIEPEYGHVFDHFSAIFTYENGVRYYAASRQQPGCDGQWQDLAFGTEGQCNLMKYTITGKNPWRGPKTRADMHQIEHDVMYAALRRGEIINNGEYMAKSTLMGIMARQSAYTGKELTWEQMMNSQESLVPEKLDWNMKLAEPPVARPGVTLFS